MAIDHGARSVRFTRGDLDAVVPAVDVGIEGDGLALASASAVRVAVWLSLSAGSEDAEGQSQDCDVLEHVVISVSC